MADCYHASRRRYYENVTQGIQGICRKGERGRYGGRRHCRRRVREDRHIARHLFLPLDGNTYATLAEAEAAGAAVLKYGSFLSQVLDFLIVSFVIFIFVKKIMALGRKKEAPVEEAPKTKVCPYCKSEIAIDATRCPHCTSELP